MINPAIRSRRLRHTALALAATVAVAGGLAACGTDAAAKAHPAATSSRAATTAAVPSPGLHMITANGHKLAFYVTPGHLPAIVLDAGGGLDASYWKKIVPTLAKKTGSEIVTYDRSGEGKSPYVPGPWRAQNAASDLAAGLTQLNATKNVILVSHSLAGEIATYYVRDHAHSVAGAVLVDASLPQFFTKSETEKFAAVNQQRIDALKGKPLTPATRQLLALADHYGPVHLAYHKLSWPTNVPATAIVSSQTPFPTPVDAQLWRQAQQEFVNAAPNRRLAMADHSSHDIPIDRPDVVIKATQDMVNQVH
ncbi:alpha/beta fold hydrolase [Streptomyces sp. NPDC093261]|uniref:alpha/beta fold hydrolase n=1 Tax=Streptomyces sp. NPDC093261 TaxID=3366037 RepID=UPI003819477F